MKTVIKKTIITALCILAAGAIFSGCGFRYSFSSGSGSQRLDKEDAKEFKVDKDITDPVTSIIIDTRIADIELIESDKFHVEIDYLYWEEEPEYSLIDGKLSFDDSDAMPDSYSIGFNLDNTIKIYLPKAMVLHKLTIDDSAGDVTLSSFVADDLKARISYGNFTLCNAAAIKADITLSAGKSKISDFQTGNLKFRNSYGDAEFHSINTGITLLSSDITYDKIDITMSSGNADIDGMVSDIIEIVNSYGNVTCKNITAISYDVSLSSGELDVSKADLNEADLKNSYGNVNLSLLGTKEDYILDLDTSYGNIKVDGKSYDDHIILDNGGARNITASLSSGNIKVSFKE